MRKDIKTTTTTKYKKKRLALCGWLRCARASRELRNFLYETTLSKLPLKWPRLIHFFLFSFLLLLFLNRGGFLTVAARHIKYACANLWSGWSRAMEELLWPPPPPPQYRCNRMPKAIIVRPVPGIPSHLKCDTLQSICEPAIFSFSSMYIVVHCSLCVPFAV